MKKIALAHDALINNGGAERVFQVFCEIFPDAPIYTSVFFPEKTLPFFKNKTIFTSPLQKIVKTEIQFKNLFPLSLYLMQKFDMSSFDIIISSSTFCAKYLKKKKAKHICYMHQPFRLLWEPNSYDHRYINLKKSLIIPFLPLFRKWDINVTKDTDILISNCSTTKKKIKNYYNLDSTVINPPFGKFVSENTETNGEYYLVVSRLEPYKRVDIAIEAFNKLELPLKVVGTGSQLDALKKISKNNIKYFHNIDDKKLKKLYENCKALVFPQEEDFGLTPIEANLFGKPVICYCKGGVETTMTPYNGKNLNQATAIFFHEQNVDCLIAAIIKFKTILFNKVVLKKNAERFSEDIFKQNILDIINSIN